MKFKEYINENLDIQKNKWTIISLTDLDQETRHKLWDMYVDTYQSIGLHIENIDKLTSKYKISWLIDTDTDSEPDAFVIYKETKHGKKLALAGSDGQRHNKKVLIVKIIELMKKNGWYAEASHKVADLLMKNNINIVTDIEVIKKVLNKTDIIPTDEVGVYKRKLGTLGIVKKKIIWTT